MGHLWAILFGERPLNPMPRARGQQALLIAERDCRTRNGKRYMQVSCNNVLPDSSHAEGSKRIEDRRTPPAFLPRIVKRHAFSTSAKREGGMGFAGGRSLLIWCHTRRPRSPRSGIHRSKIRAWLRSSDWTCSFGVKSADTRPRSRPVVQRPLPRSVVEPLRRRSSQMSIGFESGAIKFWASFESTSD